MVSLSVGSIQAKQRAPKAAWVIILLYSEMRYVNEERRFMDSLITQRCHGVVREFDKTRGCGTIEDETGEQVFVRYSAIVGQGVRTLQSGDRVAFEIEQS